MGRHTAFSWLTLLLPSCRGRSTEMPQDAIQALDVALKHSAMMSAVLVPVARAFYNPSTAKSLFGGAEVCMCSRTPLLDFVEIIP